MASKQKRVLVAMSGGVDSSVAAGLLCEQGYDVVGVTMQVWDYTSCNLEEGMGTCCSSKDVDDARRVAEKFGFPFYVVNCEAKFQAYVIDPFIESYLQGQTPLPCVNCNTFLKFEHLVQKMEELECDYIATGHYAQVLTDADGGLKICTSTDSWKDQTYFLFTLKPDLLSKLLFPVGDMTKPDVRIHAERMGLVNAKKKDSTGICFIGKRDYSDFIDERVAKDLFRAGQVRLHPTGEVLAKHTGIHNFTYGQRKGLGFTADRPLYVLRIDGETNEVWVGEEQFLYSDTVRLENANWLDTIRPDETLKVKIRFHHPGAPGRLRKDENGLDWWVDFEEPQRAVTPGQAAVVYRDRQLLGGGWIKRCEV